MPGYLSRPLKLAQATSPVVKTVNINDQNHLPARTVIQNKNHMGLVFSSFYYTHLIGFVLTLRSKSTSMVEMWVGTVYSLRGTGDLPSSLMVTVMFSCHVLLAEP